jgi:outer membrane protein OmpA-like peptidoglycan-associated protein
MGLSLQSDEVTDRVRGGGRVIGVVLLALLLAVSALGILYVRVLQRTHAMEQQLAAASARSESATALARQAIARAEAAEASAHTAMQGRQAAEAQTADARKEADTAREKAATAEQTAARAQAEADQIRKRAEAEVDRLQAALSQIADTQHTALGLVMNLGSDHLKFEFDKAELRREDRELLSRIAGILLTSHDYTISVNGHTDDIGSDAYNQKLSQRRAQAVRDYLVEAGLAPDILSVEGHGKSLPLVRGTSEAARAKNRRVELGIVHTQIRYGVQGAQALGGH